MAKVLKRDPRPQRAHALSHDPPPRLRIIIFIGIAIALTQFAVVGTLARAMLASAAIIAGVVGIAARAPIANLASGVMIAFSQPVRLGDYVSIDDVYGTVEEIRLTYTYIRTVDNRRVVIPNEAFASKIVHNYSMGSARQHAVRRRSRCRSTASLEEVRAAALEEADGLAPPPDGVGNAVDVARPRRADTSRCASPPGRPTRSSGAACRAICAPPCCAASTTMASTPASPAATTS